MKDAKKEETDEQVIQKLYCCMQREMETHQFGINLASIWHQFGINLAGVNGTHSGGLLEMRWVGEEEQQMTAAPVGPAGRSPALWPYGSRSPALIRHGT